MIDFNKELFKHFEISDTFDAIDEKDFKYIIEVISKGLGLEPSYDMYIEIYFKSEREKEILSVKDSKWSQVVPALEEWMNDPKRDSYKDIDYVVIKANKIKYYKVNTIIENLTRKVTLIGMKEKPNKI